MIIKALSIRQPWANMIATGEKTIETRGWATHYRGELLICSSKKPMIYPAGAAIAIAKMIDCREMKPNDVGLARCQYRGGLYTWVLADIRKIKPFPVKSRLRLFDVELPEGVL